VKPTRKRVAWALLALLIYFLSALVFRHLNGPRTVVRAVAPNGIEVRVVQTCNWNGELFTTRFCYRKPDMPWKWFYYDHQDGYWRNGHAEVDSIAKTISIHRKGRLSIEFNWESETINLTQLSP
jgi:hypothetical protein